MKRMIMSLFLILFMPAFVAGFFIGLVYMFLYAGFNGARHSMDYLRDFIRE